MHKLNTVKGHESTSFKTLSGFVIFIFDNLNDTFIGQAILPAKGHESMLCKTPRSNASLFFNFTLVKMKGQIND